MLIDTHCHLNMMVKKKFETPLSRAELERIETILKTARSKQVNEIITVGTNIVEDKNSIEIAKHYSDVYATVGIHPTDSSNNWREYLNLVKPLVIEKEKNKIVAIGECGLDFYWPGYNIEQQKDVFKAQIELALNHDLALTIHTRSASEETLHILEQYRGQLKGVLHCFSENQQYASYITEIGLLLGIGGTITYPKNTLLREVVKNLSLEKIVLETDAPWLPPQVIRGKQNHPQYINEIAHYIATLKGIPFEEVANQTTKNARLTFGLRSSSERG